MTPSTEDREILNQVVSVISHLETNLHEAIRLAGPSAKRKPKWVLLARNTTGLLLTGYLLGFFLLIQQSRKKSVKLGGLESVRIHFLPILEEIGKCQNWKVSELESVRIGKCQNWLALSDSDTFQFWHFPILTLSNFEEKCILTLSNSDTFQSLSN